MIVFDLYCDQNHTFEGWFQDRRSFDIQKEQGLLTCPICGSKNVHKIPSAVTVCTRSQEKSPGKDGDTSENALKEVLNKIYNVVKKNTEDVGMGFAQEALKIHYGVAKARNIRGVATSEEEKMLKKEGISFIKIPVPSKKSIKDH